MIAVNGHSAAALVEAIAASVERVEVGAGVGVGARVVAGAGVEVGARVVAGAGVEVGARVVAGAGVEVKVLPAKLLVHKKSSVVELARRVEVVVPTAKSPVAIAVGLA